MEGCVPWEASMAAEKPPVAKCCDKTTPTECGTLSPYSCTGYYKFINDDTAAKPPFLEDYEIEIVECDADTDPTCSTKCYTGAANRISASWLVALSSFVVAIMMVQ